MLWCRWTDFQSICLLLFLDKDSWLSWMRELEQPWEIMMTYSLRLMWRDKVELGSNLHLSLRCASPFRVHALWLSVIRRIGRVQGCLLQPTVTEKYPKFTREAGEQWNSSIQNPKDNNFYWKPHHWYAYFGRRGAEPLSLILLGVLCRSLSHLTLSLSLWAFHFPPPPLISSQAQEARVYSLEVALWGGWGGGVYMVGAALWCPHHWLLWIWRVRRYECVTSNNSLCLAL